DRPGDAPAHHRGHAALVAALASKPPRLESFMAPAAQRLSSTRRFGRRAVREVAVDAAFRIPDLVEGDACINARRQDDGVLPVTERSTEIDRVVCRVVSRGRRRARAERHGDGDDDGEPRRGVCGCVAGSSSTPKPSTAGAVATGRLRFCLSWALQGLNLRLIPCEGITLPLS